MRLAEIFLGFDGEVNHWGQGIPSVFIRFAGCNLSCSYCDTKQYQPLQSGESISVQEVFRKVKSIEKAHLNEASFKKVTITGGEPLLQYFKFWELVKLLDQDNWHISVETNGSMPFLSPNCDLREESLIDCFIVDYKLSSSGMSEHTMPYDFYGYLGHTDFIKFVILSREDIETAIKIQKIIQEETGCEATFAYSPCWDRFDVKYLAEALLESDGDILGNCIINYQLHKIWGDPEKIKKEKSVKLM